MQSHTLSQVLDVHVQTCGNIILIVDVDVNDTTLNEVSTSEIILQRNEAKNSSKLGILIQ